MDISLLHRLFIVSTLLCLFHGSVHGLNPFTQRYESRVNYLNETFVFFPDEADKGTMIDAEMKCSYFGSMVRIKSEREQRFFNTWLGDHAAWLGAKYQFRLFGQFRVKWNTEPNAATTYKNWGEREPNCFDQCCGVMTKKGNWGTFPCATESHILCKVNPKLVDSLIGSQSTSTTSTTTTTISTDTIHSPSSTSPLYSYAPVIEHTNHHHVRTEKQDLGKRVAELENNMRSLNMTTIEKFGRALNETRAEMKSRLKILEIDFRETIHALEKRLAPAIFDSKSEKRNMNN